MLYVDYEVGEILSVLAGYEEVFKHIQVNNEEDVKAILLKENHV